MSGEDERIRAMRQEGILCMYCNMQYSSRNSNSFLAMLLLIGDLVLEQVTRTGWTMLGSVVSLTVALNTALFLSE